MFYLWQKSYNQLRHLWAVNWIKSTWIIAFAFKIFFQTIALLEVIIIIIIIENWNWQSCMHLVFKDEMFDHIKKYYIYRSLGLVSNLQTLATRL